MNYNYKETWDSIGKFFYTANFGMVISAVIVWDSSLNGVLPKLYNLGQEWLLLSLFFICLVLLVLYYIIDWFDASIISSIDKNVTFLDVVFWLIAPLSLSVTTALLVKAIPMISGCWLYGVVLIYLIESLLVNAFRNRTIFDDEDRDYIKQNFKDIYISMSKIRIFNLIILISFFIAAASLSYALILKLLLILNHDPETIFKFKLPVPSFPEQGDKLYMLVLGGLVIAIFLNVVLKYLRHKYVTVPVYEFRKEEAKDNAKKKVQKMEQAAAQAIANQVITHENTKAIAQEIAQEVTQKIESVLFQEISQKLEQQKEQGNNRKRTMLFEIKSLIKSVIISFIK